MNLKHISRKVLSYPLHAWNKRLFYLAPFFPLPDHSCFVRPIRKNDICLILANGPSAKAILPDIVNRRSKYDIYTMNFANKGEFFFQLKPKMHILADPGLFESDVPQKIKDERNNLALALSTVNWELELAVPRRYLLQAKSIYKSPNISIINFPCRPISTYKDCYNQLLYKGYYDFGAQSVPVSALYMALMAEYKQILLAGMDVDGLTSMKVDKNNRVYFNDMHYYNSNENIRFLKESYKEQLRATLSYFTELELIKNYAKSKNIQIINLSLESMIDLFPKKNFSDIKF